MGKISGGASDGENLMLEESQCVKHFLGLFEFNGAELIMKCEKCDARKTVKLTLKDFNIMAKIAEIFRGRR